MKRTQLHPLEQYFNPSNELGWGAPQRRRGLPILAWVAVVGVTLLSVVANVAIAATPSVSATVQGALIPGVYGRIDIGNAPPPQLIFPQPVVIIQQPVQVQQQPMYLHVPPGHAKKWSKHCSKYNACGTPVYFVKVAGAEQYERTQYQARQQQMLPQPQASGFSQSYEKKDKKEKHQGNGNGNGNGHGNGKHKGDN